MKYIDYEKHPDYLAGYNAPNGANNPHVRDDSQDLRIAQLAAKEPITDTEVDELTEMVETRDNSPYARWELGQYRNEQILSDNAESRYAANNPNQ
jgi:hypothetical protein|tara:strand:+ start:884 stop:1168 length:285 start_codon:yes stop_codon:yes gene_type:complete